MEERQREQIRLILQYQFERACRSARDRYTAIAAKRGKSNTLGSTTMVSEVARSLEAEALELIPNLANEVGQVAREEEAFAELSECIGRLANYYRGYMSRAARPPAYRAARLKALHGSQSPDSIERFAVAEADRLHNLILQKLQIIRFQFEASSSGEVSALPASAAPAPSENPATASARKTGGRPLAEHWDGMWAAIAAALYAGDLNPKSQADVERAMADWLSAQDIDAGETTIKGRARKLWDLISTPGE